LILALGMLARHRQTDVDDDAPVIPVISGMTGTYLALGDSYSAGEGLEPFLPSPRPECHRSPFAYPMLMRFEQSMLTEFRARSGAVTQDVDLGIVGGHAPQLDDEPRPEVSLVTITIGGNDVVFSRVVQACFLYEDCLGATFRPPESDPARPTIVYPPAQPFDSWADAALEVLVKQP
jgi:hypothetical protein